MARRASDRALPLTRSCPSQLPQSAHREDDGDERGHAERDERPDEEEATAGIGDAAGDADTFPLHVYDRDDQQKERHDEDDDVPRSPFAEHRNSVKQGHNDRHDNQAGEPSRLHPADDVIRQMKCHEEDRQQSRDR
jgi:hypothetical protein